MAISTTILVDDSFKTIIKASGVGNETEQLLLDASELLNATSEPKVSIANVYYEVEGAGKINFNFDSEESILEISGNGNYGLKPEEPKKKSLSTVSGDILLTSDVAVTSYNIVIECHKETGFTD